MAYAFRRERECCAQSLCEVRPEDLADRAEVKVVDELTPDDDCRLLAADVCIGASGRVRRIGWSPVIGRRWKAGLWQRLAGALRRRRTPGQAASSDGRLWHVIDLCDYGCPG